ncbi:MAG: SpoIIE family protein phosphatase, partial [Bacteroidales bacterium]|nr:SpoIIE family protein phosphatase [Bacteroidales bacterium]
KDLKIKKQKNFSIFLLSGFVSIFIFLLILFSQIKRIRKRNSLLAYQKKQITDSIEYASRIQTAILPPGDFISKLIPDHFILYKPRDIVSGDFYWITHKDNKIIVAAVDCTGHGVPGAFMSMLGFAFLNEIVNKETELKANSILNQLRDYVKESLHQTGKEDEAKDGMDIALCIIDPDKQKLQYSGAYNPLYLIRDEDFILLKADRMPIGIHIIDKGPFTNHEIDIQKGDIIYIFTDGYIDQFGGPNSRKFKLVPFKEMLISIKDKSMSEQKEILDIEFAKWKGDHDQIDDVLVMGIKI